MEASFWSHALFDLGPFALIVFFALVTLPISKSQLEKNKDSQVHQWIYSLNWASVFLLGIVVTWIWITVHIVRPAEIRGEIRHIPTSFVITNDADVNDDLYTQKKDSSSPLTLYRWIVISRHPLSDGTIIPIVIAKSRDSSFELHLKVKASFYDNGVIIDYDNDKFSLLDDSKSTDLPLRNLDSSDGLRKTASAFSWSSPFFLIRTVFAQSDLAKAPLQGRLDSQDPITRRDARKDLADGGAKSLSFIDAVLSNPSSSYRLKLGSIIALNVMQKMPLEGALSLDSLVFILRSIGSDEENLRNEARRFLQKNATPAIEKKIRLSLESSEKPSDRFKRTEIALADMDLLYNLGIIEKDLYKRPQDESHVKAAIANFSSAWEARKYASTTAKIFFAKALYGWALALADISFVDRDTTGQKKPEFVAAAREKFSDFLKATQPTAGIPAYPAPAQIEQARRYLNTGTL